MPTTISGTSGVNKVQDGTVTPSDLSGMQSGNAPIFGARAWANFNGSTGAIRASGNISSIVKNSTGDYTVNLTTPLDDIYYSVFGTTSQSDVGQNLTCVTLLESPIPTINSFRVRCQKENFGVIDPLYVYIVVYR